MDVTTAAPLKLEPIDEPAPPVGGFVEENAV